VEEASRSCQAKPCTSRVAMRKASREGLLECLTAASSEASVYPRQYRAALGCRTSIGRPVRPPQGGSPSRHPSNLDPHEFRPHGGQDLQDASNGSLLDEASWGDPRPGLAPQEQHDEGLT
jgi:hypothetical protein